MILTFAPRSARAGGYTTLAALFVCIALVVVARRKGDLVASRRELGIVLALSLAPILVAKIASVAIAEPTRPSRQLATPDGAPVIADALPAGAKPVGARFDANVILEGVRLSPNVVGAMQGSDIFVDPGESLTLELDWKKTGEVPRGLGVFVHIDPSSGESLRGDHILLSGVLDLEDAPQGKTLRDIVTISVHDSLKGKRCRIFVGLWGVRRDGKRVPVTERGSALSSDDNRVEVGAFDVR